MYVNSENRFFLYLFYAKYLDNVISADVLGNTQVGLYLESKPCTIGCRVTSSKVNRENPTPSNPMNLLIESSRPFSFIISVCSKSPVITYFQPIPILVRNAFNCSGVAFWASSNITSLLAKVKPLIYANGIT